MLNKTLLVDSEEVKGSDVGIKSLLPTALLAFPAFPTGCLDFKDLLLPFLRDLTLVLLSVCGRDDSLAAVGSFGDLDFNFLSLFLFGL